uniref:Secreted protein n=1 Tax=Panagrellus redivivus TaxID=6233 RepID=A0A7E4ZRH2_PANRE
MPLKSVVFVSLVLSTATFVNALVCVDWTDPNGSGRKECPSGLCYSSAYMDVDLSNHYTAVTNETYRCATLEEARTVNKSEINYWTKKGNLYVRFCDYVDRGFHCSVISHATRDAMKMREYGYPVCNSFDDHEFEYCKGEKNKPDAMCLWTKRGKFRQDKGCAQQWWHTLKNITGKCVTEVGLSGEIVYYYACIGDLCNNDHVCDEELGLTTPHPSPALGPASPGSGQNPNQNFNETLGPVAPSATSSPKNTGSRFTVPTIAMLMLVYGVLHLHHHCHLDNDLEFYMKKEHATEVKPTPVKPGQKKSIQKKQPKYITKKNQKPNRRPIRSWLFDKSRKQ